MIAAADFIKRILLHICVFNYKLSKSYCLNRLVKSDYKKGIISIIISAFGFACMSFFVKISGDVPVMQKAIFRNLVAAVVAAIIVVRSGYKIRIGM